jgi:hypothetical protein
LKNGRCVVAGRDAEEERRLKELKASDEACE